MTSKSSNSKERPADGKMLRHSEHAVRRDIKDAPVQGKISQSQAREAAKFAKTERLKHK